MNEATVATFQHAIRAMHDAGSRFVWKERVVEMFGVEIVWQGDVLVFELDGHPTASRCFAWELDGQVTAVLEEGPVQTAQDAVRASIMSEAGEEPEAAE